MIKGVYMIKRINKLIKYGFVLGLILSMGLGQSTGYLAQKLMIENNLRKRISDALEKVIDNRKYVIDVSVDLEISSAFENQTTYSPNGDVESLKAAEDMLNATDSPSRGSVGLPIPGFDFTAESPAEDTNAPTESAPLSSPVEDNVVSRTQTEMRPSMASVRNMEISIIIQEGAAPELIENIRQVVMVASRFDRPRGDVLSIMTASFKERRDEKSAEQVLLKNIAEKLESLESQRERLGEVDWKQELENYKDSEINALRVGNLERARISPSLDWSPHDLYLLASLMQAKQLGIESLKLLSSRGSSKEISLDYLIGQDVRVNLHAGKSDSRRAYWRISVDNQNRLEIDFDSKKITKKDGGGEIAEEFDSDNPIMNMLENFRIYSSDVNWDLIFRLYSEAILAMGEDW